MNSTVKLHADCPASGECPPHDPHLHSLWHQGHFQECEKEFRAILAKCPSCPDANIQLTGCLGALGRYEEEDALLEELLVRAADDDQLASFCGRKGRTLLECFGPSQALPWFKLAAELDPYAGWLSALASALWAQSKRKAAADFAEQALAEAPYDPPIIGRCVSILMKSGRREAARAALLALAQQEYDIPEYHLAVAEGLVLAGLERRGLAVGRRAATMYPESLSLACVMSHLLMDAGKPKAAAPLLRRTRKLDPAGHGKFALMNLALIAGESGDIERMLHTAVQANVEFNDADTRRLLRNTIKMVTSQVRERDTAFGKLSAEHARVRGQHEALEASLAGYDTSEGGTNLEYALREGEGWHIEFKQCMPGQARNLGIEIAALSSQTGGGTIFIGVRDNGDVVGVGDVHTLKQRDEWRHRIAGIATKAVQPPNPVTVYFNEREGIDVIKIWVPEGTQPVYYVDHIAYIRNLDESRKATPEEIAEYIARRSSPGGRNGR